MQRHATIVKNVFRPRRLIKGSEKFLRCGVNFSSFNLKETTRSHLGLKENLVIKQKNL